MTNAASPRPVLALHGGCGAIPRARLTPEFECDALSGIRRALTAGHAVLDAGGPALEAVTATVCALEDDPTFNAGYGATLNRAGEHELDSSVMDGATGRAGAVAGVRRIKHPVLAARRLCDEADPLMLIGEAADRWAEASGLETVDNAHFTTASRTAALAAMLERIRLGTVDEATEQDKHGTVGAVALDAAGHLAAATSTGGFTAKAEGRVGDSPIVGAGTWADDETCAVSGTGKGELFVRTALAHTIHDRLLYLGDSLEAAAAFVIERVGELGGGAGLCAVDRAGNVVLPFNTEGMYRGFRRGEDVFAAIY